MGYFLRLVNGVPRMREEAATAANPEIYEASIEVVSPIVAGTSITLPNGETFDSKELEIKFNGLDLEQIYDYVYVGSVPRTQIQLTFALAVGDRLDFRKTRNI
jgi:hypothetical protein